MGTFLTPEEVRVFQELVKQDQGVILSYGEAADRAYKLVQLFELISKHELFKQDGFPDWNPEDKSN
jgi:protein tyrosine phosphatase (PTP) superfamily phosphohydrolase (DUF442 family)